MNGHASSIAGLHRIFNNTMQPMNQISHNRVLALAAFVLIGICTGAHAQSSPGAASAPPPSAPAEEGFITEQTGVPPAGDIAELQRLTNSNALDVLRASRNGSYGADLLFDGKLGTYYVALVQQRDFWRVVKTQDERRAQAVYATFSRQAERLAEVEMRRIKLEAQKVQTEQRLAITQAKQNRLQADIDIAREQQTLATSRQEEARSELTGLRAQQEAAQAQLRETQGQLGKLQHQLDAGLPAVRRKRGSRGS